MSKRTMFVVMVVLSSCWKPPDEMKDGPDASVTTSVDGGLLEPRRATLELSPSVLTIPLGASAAVRVTQVQLDGTEVDLTATAELRSEPEGLVTFTQGQVRAVAAGATMLIAKANGLEARASVTVPAAQVQSIEIVLAEPSVTKGALIEASALATLTDGTRLDVTQTAKWSVHNPLDVAQVLELLGPGRLIAKGGGIAEVRATLGTSSAAVSISVSESRLEVVMVTPALASLPLNGSVTLTATGRFADGTEADLSRAVTWTSSGPSITVDAKGVALAKSAGTATVFATLDGREGSAVVTVVDAAPTRLTFMPGSLNVGVRGAGTFRVVATLADGSTADVTAQAAFSSSAPGVASVSSSGVRGQVTGLSAGNADITAHFGMVSASAPVVVTAAAVQSIELTPRVLTLAGSGTASVRARATYTDGSQADVTEQALWVSDDATIVTVSNAASSRGVVRGLNGGSTVVSASLGSVRGQATVTVQAATVLTLELSPAMVSVEAGRSTNVRAVVLLSDNTRRDVTQQSVWTSVTPAVATVSDQPMTRGLVRGVVNGTTTIRATYQGQTASAQVLVQPATMTSLSISPAAVSVPLGLPYGFEAIAAFSDGTAYPVTTQVQWSSSNTGVAEVLMSQGYAYLDSKQAGSTVITATMEGLSASTTVTVTTASLSRIDVTPAQPRVPVGSYLQLEATGVYSDLTTQFFRYVVSWTSSNTSVAAVGNSQQDKGFLTAIGAGTTTITATFGGVSTSMVVTVTGATLTEIQVTPFAPRLPIGFDTYLRATGLYSDNSTRDLTYFVSWTSTDSSIAAVGTQAFLQPLQAGTASVTATFNGVQGSTTITVTSATLTRIDITSPAMGPVAVQATRQLAARGTFSDGQLMDVTPYVTWLSSAPAIAAANNAWPTYGEVKGLSVGMATITAVRAGVSATLPLVVQ